MGCNVSKESDIVAINSATKHSQQQDISLKVKENVLLKENIKKTAVLSDAEIPLEPKLKDNTPEANDELGSLDLEVIPVDGVIAQPKQDNNKAPVNSKKDAFSDPPHLQQSQRQLLELNEGEPAMESVQERPKYTNNENGQESQDEVMKMAQEALERSQREEEQKQDSRKVQEEEPAEKEAVMDSKATATVEEKGEELDISDAPVHSLRNIINAQITEHGDQELPPVADIQDLLAVSQRSNLDLQEQHNTINLLVEGKKDTVQLGQQQVTNLDHFQPLEGGVYKNGVEEKEIDQKEEKAEKEVDELQGILGEEWKGEEEEEECDEFGDDESLPMGFDCDAREFFDS